MERDAGGQKIGKKQIPDHMEIQGASVHFLKHIDVDILLHEIVGIAGVPGSGKSSLALGVLYTRVHGDIFSHPSFEGAKKRAADEPCEYLHSGFPQLNSQYYLPSTEQERTSSFTPFSYDSGGTSVHRFTPYIAHTRPSSVSHEYSALGLVLLPCVASPYHVTILE